MSHWIRFTAPALFTATALLQLALTHAGPLTPAKGGGFGLFSTVDKLENRVLLAWLETPGGDKGLTVVGFDHEAQNALAFPTQDSLDRLGAVLAGGSLPAEGTAVRVEVWKRTFDSGTGVNRRVLLAKRSVPRAR